MSLSIIKQTGYLIGVVLSLSGCVGADLKRQQQLDAQTAHRYYFQQYPATVHSPPAFNVCGNKPPSCQPTTFIH